MKDSMTKVSIRVLFAVIGTLLKLIVSPLWLIYFLCVATLPAIQMFFAWLHNNEDKYSRAKYRWEDDTQVAFKFWKFNV